jgi:hypothetical protein
LALQLVAEAAQHSPLSHSNPVAQSASPSSASQTSPAVPGAAQTLPRQTVPLQHWLLALQPVAEAAQHVPLSQV